MAVYQNRGREAAERIIKLRDYLSTNATPAHAVKSRDMLAFLESIGHKVEIKTLYSDLNTLTAYFGLDLQYDGRQRGYTLNNPQFEAYELRMIVNSIQTAQFITQQEADRLTAKIMSELADKYTRPSLQRKTYIPNRVHAVNEDAMKGLDNIYEAIAQDRKISFKYFVYTLTGYERTKKYRSFDNSKIITASPYSVVWEIDKFWVFSILKVPKTLWYKEGLNYSVEYGKYIDYNGELIDDEDIANIDFQCNDMDDSGLYVYEIQRFDVGLMEQIKILPEKREGKNVAQEWMDGRDIPDEITRLKADKEYVSNVLDRFGDNISIKPDGDTFFIATVHEDPTPELYLWTQRFNPPIRIIYPENAEAGFKKYFLSLARGEAPDGNFYGIINDSFPYDKIR